MRRTAPDPDPERWDTIETVCFEAMRLDGEERDAYLERRCAGDADLRQRVEELLAAFDRAPAFLERPGLALMHLEPLLEEELPEDPRAGRYRLIRPLGHGGMGDVFLATMEGDGFERTVAVKLIRKGLDTARVLERFRLERRILAQLRHPNIAGLLDGGATEDGRPFFVMEYVEGEAVDDYCQRRDLDRHARLRLVETVCDAVHHAHQNLIVHRDIKPANILVTPEGVPKLLDFGIGKILSDEAPDGGAVTRVEERALTPDFAAPEILRGEPVTTATDVYGLGALLHTLLVGAPPGQAGAGGAGRPGGVPGELQAIVLRALADDPGERYGSAAALAEDLRRFREGRPVRARVPGPLYSARKFVGRHRVGVAAAVLVLASVVAGWSYTARQSRRVAVERDRALEVRGFLLESFGAAGANRAVGDAVTARALLDGQAAVVRESYADRPALQAEMMVVLAEGYERLGLFSEGLTWAEEALALRGAGPPGERAAAATLVGWITHQLGRSADALPVLERAVSDARAAGNDRVLARALNDRGVVQEALGDFDAAGESHREALALRTALFGPDHRSVGVSASNLSVIRYRQGDLEGAVEEATRALRAVRSAFGPDHQRAIIVQGNLAVFRLVAGDLQGAEEDFRDLWARQARIQGPEHPVTVRVMNSLASVLRQQEKWMEAESVLREVLRIMDGWDEVSPTDRATTLANLGDAVSARGDHGDGEALLREALDLQIAALGPDHLDVANSRVYLSGLFERWGNLEEALSWRTQAAATFSRVLGPGREPTLTQRLEEARLLQAVGRTEEGDRVLDGVVRAGTEALGGDHPLVVRARAAREPQGGE